MLNFKAFYSFKSWLLSFLVIVTNYVICFLNLSFKRDVFVKKIFLKIRKARLMFFKISPIIPFKKVLQVLKLVFLSSIIFLFCVSPSLGQETFTLDTDSVSRGTTLIVTSNLPMDKLSQPENIFLMLNGKKVVSANAIDKESKSVEFNIPKNVELNSYIAKIDILSDQTIENGQSISQNKRSIPIIIKNDSSKKLQIVSEAGFLSPKIDSVSKIVAFPENETYSFDVIGSGFSEKGKDNKLIISTIKKADKTFAEGKEVEVCWENEKDCESSSIKGQVLNSRQIKFSNIPKRDYNGGVGLQIRVGETESTPSYLLTLSPVDRNSPFLITLGIFLALVAMIVFFIKKGSSSSSSSELDLNIEKTKYGFWSALLIDQKTNTYSLTRLQFYLWTGVAIFSYLYLMLSRSLVQGQLEFIDIPDGLPGIVLISATTTVVSEGITTTKGSKGGGNIKPEFSNLITTGGVVAPERFQFLLWTVLGVLAYLFVVLWQSPEQIKDLPQIPSGFLELMGISSAGYLGGKLARKPGPFINTIESSREGNSLVLKIQGSNLSSDGTFKLNQSKQIPLSSVKRLNEISENNPSDLSLFKYLELVIEDPKAQGWNENAKDINKLTIYNPDSQYSEQTFANPFLPSDSTEQKNFSGITNNSEQTSPLQDEE
ncbi:MAG: hypothetical protein VKJ02_01195 [Snowella sp.]|nr:hypothetical protein [Snowella sp.]